MPFTPASHPGTLHHFTPRLFAFEHAPAHPQSPQRPHNTLLFLGGLADDLLHPSYPSKLAAYLPPTWTVAELHLSSSGKGWATSSLHRDADDLGSAVAYFRALPGRAEGVGARIVLMGHSTGAQVCTEYLVAAPGTAKRARPRVDGVVMQAGVSDREGLVDTLGRDKLDESVRFAEGWVRDGKGEDVLPASVTESVFGASPCARRWVSLASVGGGDDFFSSDLGAERVAGTFGRLGVPVCCLLSGRDEHMPEWVDKEALLRLWKGAVLDGGGVWSGESGVVPGASHDLNKDAPDTVRDLCSRVASFVQMVESGSPFAKKTDGNL